MQSDQGGQDGDPFLILCPGCPKCAPNGGLVLRRGSWRPTSSWEPILLLAKGPGYYADGESVRVPHLEPWRSTGKLENRGTKAVDGEANDGFGLSGVTPREYNPAGANLRDVWTLPAEPLSTHWCPQCMTFYDACPPSRQCRKCKVKLASHYASFSTELVYRCLAAGTSQRGYCPQCGRPWARVVETKAMVIRRSDRPNGTGKRTDASGTMESPAECATLGWRPTCKCGPDLPPRPALVLDMFCGSGRVAVQCQRLGLDFIGIDLNAAYVALAERQLDTSGMPLFRED